MFLICLKLTLILGRFCGSSYLNQRFREQIEKRLQNETYLESIEHFSLEKSIQEAVNNKWERDIKPTYPCDESEEDNGQPYYCLSFPGLRDSRERGFRGGDMLIMKYVYMISPIYSDAYGKQVRYRGSFCTDTRELLAACSFPNISR